MLNLEARERLPCNFDLSGFFRHRVGEIHKNNNFAGAAVPNRDELKGVGLMLGWTASMGLHVSATLAHRIGSNPDPTNTGTDQDGSLDKNRLWLQAWCRSSARIPPRTTDLPFRHSFTPPRPSDERTRQH